MGFQPSSHTGSQWSDTEKRAASQTREATFTQKRPFLTVKMDNNTLQIKNDGY